MEYETHTLLFGLKEHTISEWTFGVFMLPLICIVIAL